jgi:hypothetical protein
VIANKHIFIKNEKKTYQKKTYQGLEMKKTSRAPLSSLGAMVVVVREVQINGIKVDHILLRVRGW